MLVNLVKRTGTYFSEKDQKDKPYVNFYLQCNDQLIPIELKYFPQDKFDGRDPGYQKRLGIMEFCADLLPEKDSKANDSQAAVTVDSMPTEKSLPATPHSTESSRRF